VHIYVDTFAPTPHTTRSIGQGFVVLLGVAQGDTEAHADRIVDKIIGLRVFADAEAKMNLDLRQVGGALLVVSQFTLLADLRKGRRPSFIDAAAPEAGEALYRYVVQRLRAAGFTVETGEFGAHMVVEIANDGPVTILLDTAQM
jgi:D-tyrosyl-tRNA(Tyr) deacylase